MCLAQRRRSLRRGESVPAARPRHPRGPYEAALRGTFAEIGAAEELQALEAPIARGVRGVETCRLIDPRMSPEPPRACTSGRGSEAMFQANVVPGSPQKGRSPTEQPEGSCPRQLRNSDASEETR